MSTAFLLERANTQQFLDYLKNDANAEDVKARLIAVLESKLGHTELPLKYIDSPEDRMQRFFDTVLEVAPLPPVPYTADEIIPFINKAVVELRSRRDECLADEDPEEREAAPNYEEDAVAYEKMADLFAKGDEEGARKVHREMDTYTREWLFPLDGADASRYYAKVTDR